MRRIVSLEIFRWRGKLAPEAARSDAAARRAAVVALALLAATSCLSADPLIRHAEEAQKAGNGAMAASLYREWLHVNLSAPGAALVFSGYFSAERDFSTLITESRAFLGSGKGLRGAADQFLRIARLFDVSGRIEEARDAYLAAWGEGAPDASLLRAALLSLEMNDTDSFTAAATSARGRPVSAFLEAVAAARAGDLQSATGRLVELAARTDDPDSALKALWVLSVFPPSSGADAARSGAAALETRFAGSPEAALLATPAPIAAPGAKPPALAYVNVRLSPLPGPVAFLESLEASPAAASDAPGPGGGFPADASIINVPAAAPPTLSEPAAATTPAAASPVLYMVQAGSFQVRENADDLVTDLTKKGFTSSILGDTVQGRARYRVLAGAGLTMDDAQTVLARLKSAGFSGFLQAEKSDPASSGQPSG